MRRIMVNTAIDFYRKNVRRRTEAAIQTLSPAYRSVFNLYVIEGFSHREIAEQLGITESTSRSNLVKARHKAFGWWKIHPNGLVVNG